MRKCHGSSESGVPRIPRPQDQAPQFKGQAVVNRQFKEISLKDYNGKWVILFFYPLDLSVFTYSSSYQLLYNLSCGFSTFVCPTEIVAFSDRAADFKVIQQSAISNLLWTLNI